MSADDHFLPLDNSGVSAMDPDGADSASADQQNEPSRAKVWGKRVLWGFFAILCLIFFTVLKLPEDRIKNYIRGTIASVLSTQGIGFASTQEFLSIGWGVSYVLKDVTLTIPPAGDTVHIDQISVAPAIIPALMGKLGGSFWIKQGMGSINGTVSMRGEVIDADVSLGSFEVQKTGLLPALAGVQVNATITGKANFHGDPNQPSGWEGKADLDLKNVGLEQQNIMGFSIPRVTVSTGKVDVVIERSKLTFRTLQLGKSGNATDDLQATLTGDIQLAKQWNTSVVNTKANFSLSPAILKSFAILDAILGAGKQPDGSYSFQFNGPMMAVTPSPLGPNAR